MSYDVVLSLEAVEDVLRITAASDSKAAVVNASKQLQEALRSDPANAGEHLSEGFHRLRAIACFLHDRSQRDVGRDSQRQAGVISDSRGSIYD